MLGEIITIVGTSAAVMALCDGVKQACYHYLNNSKKDK